MSKDGPASGRIGFGFIQARQAGAPYVNDRSTPAVNLGELVKSRPNLSKKVAGLIKKGERNDIILSKLREAGLAGRYYVEFIRDLVDEELLAEHWSDNATMLRNLIEFNFRVGLYKHANLFICNLRSKKWSLVQAFNRDTTVAQ